MDLGLKGKVVLLSALAMAGFILGCGENSVTGVDQRDVQVEATQNGDTPTDNGKDGWW